MVRYIHGSEDSLDVDVYYVFDELPEFSECRRFCSEDKDENRNIIVIRDGIVSECFIGTVDEINNALIDTYPLHKQEYPLLVTRRVERDVVIKSIRAVRGILSLISRSQYRAAVKGALNANWKERVSALSSIDFTTVNYQDLDKQYDGTHIKKVIAFQIGQTLGLYDGVELYTKSEIARTYPELRPFLYREEDSDISVLDKHIKILADTLRKVETKKLSEREVLFVEAGRAFDLRHENEISVGGA